MAKGTIDPRLAEALRANPNVLRVTPRTVVFAPSFIEYALSQYLNAGKATQSFTTGIRTKGRST